MEIRKRQHQILVVCIVAIAVFALVEIVYIQINKLSEPVFTESYMEIALPEIKMYDNEMGTDVELRADGLYYPLDTGAEASSEMGIQPGSDRLVEQLNGECQFELKYITNINDPIQVASIVFDEALQLNVYVSENPDENWSGVFYEDGNENESGRQCGRYAVRTMYVTIQSDEFGESEQLLMDLIKNNKSLELNHATIETYINGEVTERQKVDLGRIILTPTKSAESILEIVGGDGGSYDERETFIETYEVKKRVRIVSVDSPLLQDTQKNVGIKIANVDYTKAAGVQLAEGDILTIESWISQAKGRGRSCMTYGILPIITFEDEMGNLYEHQMIEMNSSDIYADYTCKEVRQYLKGRGVI